MSELDSPSRKRSAPDTCTELTTEKQKVRQIPHVEGNWPSFAYILSISFSEVIM